ncbi:MAG: TetR/AcrR family transcriptional regulator, partial [Elusimicrobia bacterium]|nr:TetR/AcrR family transcriptional regulator [Elusimicrobiota bacterium]
MKAPELLEAKKRRILSSACRLLVKHGFQDISLDEVARSAGVAKGTLFLHYKNKSDLFSAVFADMVDRLGDELEKIVASGCRGRALLDETVRVILT